MRNVSLISSASAVGAALLFSCGGGGFDDFQPCPDGQTYDSGTCLTGHEIRANSVGYLPLRAKRAVFHAEDGDFRVVTAEDDREVYSGEATGPIDWPDTDETNLWVADFSALTEPGRYYVVASGERSAAFRIADDAFVEPLEIVMLGLYGQRCGEEVSFEFEGVTYGHGACHLEPASLERLGGDSKDDTGGWHDAGDYGKYTRNAAFAVAFLLAAAEHFPELAQELEFRIPEKGGEVPDLLDEARVQVEWLLKVQLEDGSFSHKVTKPNFEGVTMPESDNGTRYFVSASSHATGNSVAVLAQAARLYAPFDEEFADACLAAARKGQEFLASNPEELDADQKGIETGSYGSSGDDDERAWAIVELWETTGEQDLLELAESRLSDMSSAPAFDWPEASTLAIGTYLRSSRDGKDEALVAELERNVVSGAAWLVQGAQTDPYGRGFDQYYWGTNGVIVRMSYQLALAHLIQPSSQYLDAIVSQIDHVLGRNTYNRSFVSRLGLDPVRFPHHRPSEADGLSQPWPGLLIGGPHSNRFQSENSEVPEALTWTDEYENYLHNEVAINWNTALVYALVSAQATADEEGDACVLDCPSGLGGMGGMGGTSSLDDQ